MSQSMSVEAVLSAYDENFSATLEKALKSINGLSRESQSASSTVSSSGAGISGTFKSMAGAMGLVAVAGKAWGVIKDSMSGAIDRFDTLNKYPVVMKALNYSTRDVAKSTSILSKGIDGLPTSLQDVTSVAQQLAPLTGSATKASKSAIALNNAFLASGASVADTSRGLQQYTQMLSTGKVDLMSYRTLMETMPIALRKVANSFGFTGKSAEQDLYNALKSGQITVDQLNDRFIKLNGGVGGFAELAKKNSAGIATSFANLKNSVVKNLANMLSAINDGFSKAGFGSIAQVLDNMKVGINSAFQVIGPVVTNATVVILNFAKVVGSALKSAFSNDIFRSAIVGVISFIAAFSGILKIIGMIKAVSKAITVVKVAAAVAKDVNLLKFALTNMSKESKVAATALKVLNIVTSMNPWVILATAIVAVVAALAYFFTQTKTGQALWKSFVQWLQSAWSGLKEFGSEVWQALGDLIKDQAEKTKEAWNGITEFFSNLWTGIVNIATTIWDGLVAVFTAIVTTVKTIWQGISSFFTTLWTGIITIATTIWNMIIVVVTTVVTTIQAVWSGFANFMNGLWSGIVTVATAIWNTLVSIISTAWNAITSIISGAISVVESVVSSGFNSARGIVQSIMNAMRSVISAVWNTIKSLFSAGVNFIKSVVHIDLGAAGRAIMNSLWNGMKSIWNGIKNWVSGIADWIKEHKGPISYDRRLLIPAGKAIMNGLNNGLINGFGEVQSNVSNMADQIQNAINIPDFDVGASMRNIGAINANYTGSLAIQDSSLQMQNNELLRQLVNKDTTMVLDDGTLVGYTATKYDQRLGQNAALKGRWSR